jgi:hypothetical protein
MLERSRLEVWSLALSPPYRDNAFRVLNHIAFLTGQVEIVIMIYGISH